MQKAFAFNPLAVLVSEPAEGDGSGSHPESAADLEVEGLHPVETAFGFVGAALAGAPVFVVLEFVAEKLAGFCDETDAEKQTGKTNRSLERTDRTGVSTLDDENGQQIQKRRHEGVAELLPAAENRVQKVLAEAVAHDESDCRERNRHEHQVLPRRQGFAPGGREDFQKAEVRRFRKVCRCQSLCGRFLCRNGPAPALGAGRRRRLRLRVVCFGTTAVFVVVSRHY